MKASLEHSSTRASTPRIPKIAALVGLLISTLAVDASADDAPAGWTVGKSRYAAWKHKDEKPTATITAANVAQYSEQLSPGQIALFKANPGYEMPIYPAHNECSYPEWYSQNNKANASRAKLDPSGSYLIDAVLPGVIFESPRSGSEAMWNFETRYQGVGSVYQWRTYVAAPPGGTNPIVAESVGSQYFPWGKKGSWTPAQGGDLQSGQWFKLLTPAALAGQGGTLRNYFSKTVESYYYFPGQRRVRRMPSYAYDAPQVGYENQYTVDEVFMFYGAIDRFNWKIVGKRQMYVPYNSFAVYRNEVDFSKAMTPSGINPEFRRYELHEVLVVEGALKSDVRHISSKKIFYMDPLSWNILAGEDLDGQGRLFKYREQYTIPFWEIGGACTGIPSYQFNFQSGRYLSDNIVFGQKADPRFFEAAGAQPQFTDAFYSSQGLQSVSER
jgi:hypothetical protein